MEPGVLLPVTGARFSSTVGAAEASTTRVAITVDNESCILRSLGTFWVDEKKKVELDD